MVYVAVAFAPVTDDFGIAFLAKDLLPYFQISGDESFPGRRPLEAGHQKQERRGRTKCRPRGTGGDVLSAKRLIEASQPGRGEVGLLRLADPRQCVKISRQPAIVPGQQPDDKIFRRIRARPHQVLPHGLRVGSARHDHPSRTNANMTSIKIEGSGNRKQFSQSDRLLQGHAGFPIAASECPVKTGQDGIAEKGFKQVVGILSIVATRCGPVAC